jgi:SAM-dependent methyltransferase
VTISSSDYKGKPSHYFSGARKTFVDDLPLNPEARLLEIGCGNGDTAAYALACRKCGWCAGVELCPDPAMEAAQRLHDVQVGDIEELILPWPRGYFDLLIMSEVLEHLRDPWAVLKKIHPLLKAEAWVLSGSPNVAHHSVLRMLLRGRWDYDSIGIMDHTHLRWFTSGTYRAMFEECGYEVVSVGPAAPLRTIAKWIDRVTLGRCKHLLHSQIYLRARRR